MSNEIIDSMSSHLDTEGVGTVGTDIWTGPERPWEQTSCPPQSIFMFVSDGYQPEPYFGSASNRKTYRQVFVEVFVRDAGDKFEDCSDRALEVYNLLDREHLTGITGFVRCDGLRSAPTYYGRNKDEQHLFHIRFKVSYDHTKT